MSGGSRPDKAELGDDLCGMLAVYLNSRSLSKEDMCYMHSRTDCDLWNDLGLRSYTIYILLRQSWLCYFLQKDLVHMTKAGFSSTCMKTVFKCYKKEVFTHERGLGNGSWLSMGHVPLSINMSVFYLSVTNCLVTNLLHRVHGSGLQLESLFCYLANPVSAE